MKHYIHVDAGVRPNPGTTAAVGAVVKNGHKEIIATYTEIIKNPTKKFLNNNNMEWIAITKGMQFADKHYGEQIRELEIYTDSSTIELIVNKGKELKKSYQSYQYAKRALRILERVRKKYPVSVTWVMRKKNYEVNRIVSKVLYDELNKEI